MERKIGDINRIKKSKYPKKMLMISLALLGILNSNPLSAQKETTSQRIKKIHQKIAKEQRKPTAEEQKILYPRAPVSHKASPKKYKIKKVKLKKHKNNNHSSHNPGEISGDGGEDEIRDLGDKIIDDDKDGIINGTDLCPDTPYDVKVDKDGCPIDSDGDGIADYLDLCPDEVGIEKLFGCPENLDEDSGNRESDTITISQDMEVPKIRQDLSIPRGKDINFTYEMKGSECQVNVYADFPDEKIKYIILLNGEDKIGFFSNGGSITFPIIPEKEYNLQAIPYVEARGKKQRFSHWILINK